jgi:hypothetical protein
MWLFAIFAVVDLTEVPPVITLDLSSNYGYNPIHALTDTYNEHRICHTGTEYSGIGHPGSPLACDAAGVGEDHPRFQQTYAKHCMVSENIHGAKNCPGADCTCPEPTAQAFDHHQGQIDVVKTVHLLMRSDPRSMPVPLDVTLADIDYGIRGEYTLRYEAEDESGNAAENVLFAMIMLDHEAPAIFMPALFPDVVQSCDVDGNYVSSSSGSHQIIKIPPTATARDLYDLVVDDRLKATVASPSGASHVYSNAADSANPMNNMLIDSYSTGTYTITYKAEDFANLVSDPLLTSVIASLTVLAYPPYVRLCVRSRSRATPLLFHHTSLVSSMRTT